MKVRAVLCLVLLGTLAAASSHKDLTPAAGAEARAARNPRAAAELAAADRDEADAEARADGRDETHAEVGTAGRNEAAAEPGAAGKDGVPSDAGEAGKDRAADRDEAALEAAAASKEGAAGRDDAAVEAAAVSKEGAAGRDEAAVEAAAVSKEGAAGRDEAAVEAAAASKDGEALETGAAAEAGAAGRNKASEAGAAGNTDAARAAGAVGEDGTARVIVPARFGWPRQCGRYYSSNGVITSPNYPGYYSDNTDCTYYVTGSSGARIKLVFNYFDLETNYDFLTISGGGTLIGRYTGSSLPPVLTLSGTVTLRFTTDYSIVKRGFSITFATLATCGGTVVGSGLVRSPGYPTPYSNNLRCVWDLVATQGQTVTLDFQSFNVENNYDWVELYDGSSLVARYTGTLLPPRATLGSVARVVFTTDISVTYSGFSIVANSAALLCGGLIGGYTAISSPNYPNSYQNNALCSWTYRAPPYATSARLTFTAFNLESNYDYVKIYNGQTLYSSLTGTSLPQAVVLTSRTITVVFTSDYSIVRPGFRLVFTPQ